MNRTVRQQHTEKVTDIWEAAIRSSFHGIGQLSIAYIQLLHSNDHPTIVVSPGRCEGYEKYKDIALTLYHAGYNVFIIDHRGQGLSGRMLTNPHKGYVAEFDDYAEDLNLFIQKVVVKQITERPFLLAHSMGAAIAIRTLQLHPTIVKSAALCSPMIQINSGSLPLQLAKVLVSARCVFDRLFTNEANYFVGQSNYKAKPFESNELTHSQTRYQQFIELYKSMPEIQLGGVTNHWLSEAIKAKENIFEQINQLRAPLLVLQAGMDTIVDNNAQNEFCQSAAKFCPINGPIVFAKAKHELLFEKDNIRTEAITQIKNFFHSTT